MRPPEHSWLSYLFIVLFQKKKICGPAQLNIHLERVSDHGDKHDLVFSGLSTFMKRHVDSVGSVQRPLSAMLANACGRYSDPNKSSFRSDHHSQPTHGTHAADQMLAHALGHS
jgi:hypothetical protein